MTGSYGLAKEVCSSCLNNINIGQAIIECSKCDCVIHHKCYTRDQYDSFLCEQCVSLDFTRYNPFSSLISDDNNRDSNLLTDSISKMSQILEKCKCYSVSDFNSK